MKKRIGIISNYGQKCGISQYTENLLKGFNRHGNDIVAEVIEINSALVKVKRKTHKKRKHQHWLDIANKSKRYDAVNIQFENGIFGNNNSEVLKNLETLIKKGNKNITITMHTVDYGVEVHGSGIRDSLKFLLKLEFKNARACLTDKYRAKFLDSFINLISKSPNVKLIVHTERERKKLKMLFDFDAVYSHPLSFTDNNDREDRPERNSILNKYGINKNDVCISIYGFISEYKGHQIAINALEQLPDNYKLLIVGAQHPASIRPFSGVDEYIDDLLKGIETKNEINLKRKFHGIDADLQKKLYGIEVEKADEKVSIFERICFAGSVSDQEMLDIMKTTDVAIFPYLEVGQSASGPATMQLEVGGRILFSGAHHFRELNKYSDSELKLFDIGNYLELAQLIKVSMDDEKVIDNKFNAKFSLKTNIEFYKETLLKESNK